MNQDSAWFVQEFHDWLSKHDVAYESYWNSDDNFAGKLTDANHAHLGAEYKDLFGHPSTAAAAGDTVAI